MAQTFAVQQITFGLKIILQEVHLPFLSLNNCTDQNKKNYLSKSARVGIVPHQQRSR
jgi:hypothetical protein